MRKTLISLVAGSIAALTWTAVPGAGAALIHTNYPLPRGTHSCRVDYHKINRHHWVRRDGRRVRRTYVDCVYRAPLTTITTPVNTSVQASVDPNWTLDVSSPQSPPVPVTFSFSASAGASALPNGTLSLSVFVDGSVSNAGGCSANVGGATAAATCRLMIPAWGQYSVISSYSGGSGSGTTVSATEGTEIVDIEPPSPNPETIINSWGTTTPTNGTTVKATVIGSTADVTVDNSNFEGAASVGVSDQLGDSCTAPVSGTAASCSMSLTGSPSAFTVAYPGGTNDMTTQTIDPWGTSQQQNVTYEWPAESVYDGTPTVTIQQATMQYDDVITRTSSNVTINDYGTTPPSVIALAPGDSISIEVQATGSLSTDSIGQGSIAYSTTPNDGTFTMTDMEESASTNCSGSWNGSGAIGTCRVDLGSASSGSYTIQESYDSTDPNYASVDNGLTLTVDVS